MIAAPGPAGSGETGNFWQKDGQICISSIDCDHISWACLLDNLLRLVRVSWMNGVKSRETDFEISTKMLKIETLLDSLNEQAGINDLIHS